jgi:hypothetical protein
MTDIGVIVESISVGDKDDRGNDRILYVDQETEERVSMREYLLPYLHNKLPDLLDDFVERGVRLDSDKVNSDTTLTILEEDLKEQGAELDTYTTQDMVDVLVSNRYSAKKIYHILGEIDKLSQNQRKIITDLEKEAVDDMEPEQIIYVKYKKSSVKATPIRNSGDSYFPFTVVSENSGTKLRAEADFPTMLPGTLRDKGEFIEIHRELLKELYVKEELVE